MKIITGYFNHETNPFSNLPTGLEESKQHGFPVGALIERVYSGTKTSLGGVHRRGAPQRQGATQHHCSLCHTGSKDDRRGV